jgi:hypothetical protein
VAIISNTIFNMMVYMNICKQPPKRYNVSSLVTGGNSSSSHVTISIPLIQNQENSDAERRRLKALKALKERLKKPDEEDEVKTQWSSDTISTSNLIDPSQSSNISASAVSNSVVGVGSSGPGPTLVSQINERSKIAEQNLKIVEDGLD